MTLRADVDLEAILFLERHETRVHALPGRRVRDLGDCVLLHDPLDREPFWNRVAGVRWPDAADAFDRRLAETLALFATLDRIPHIWPRPLLNEPSDLAARLLANGWEDAGGGQVMLLVEPARASAVDQAGWGPGVTVERLHLPDADAARRAAPELALVLTEAFDVDPGRRATLELEALATWERPEVSTCLVRVDGEPAAAAKRTSFEGASYLSSIGTRPAFRGRGLGRLVTAAVTADAIAAGDRWTYLGVFVENEPAIRLYEGLGYALLGEPAPDLLLR